MNLAGVICLNLEEKIGRNSCSFESGDSFPKLGKDLLPVSQIFREIVLKINLES